MLVVEQNKYFTNWSIGQAVHPMEYAGDVVIAFDPSKTNMAMVLGTPDGTVLNVLEFSGNNRKRGPVMDTTVYCEEVRQFLTEYLKHANLYCVGVEQAITKKGVNYHHSNMVLTEIRSNILNFFLETFGIKVIEVNNWSWKAGILPKGYRSPYEKGSKRYFQEQFPTSPYCNYFEADVTDCLCIFKYLVSTKCTGYNCFCNKVEKSLSGFTYFYTSVNNTMTDGMKPFKFNNRFSLEDNMAFYSNRSMVQFYLTVPIHDIDINDVYGKSVAFDFSDLDAESLKVVAKRK